MNIDGLSHVPFRSTLTMWALRSLCNSVETVSTATTPVQANIVIFEVAS